MLKGTGWTPASLVACALALTPTPAAPEVVRVEIDRREIVLDGAAFGEAGAYEKLVGRIFFEFDPDNPVNRVVDLQLAPTNGAGRVEAWANFMVLQPVDPARRRGLAWFEVSNRGGKASLRYFNRAPRGASPDPTVPADFGDGLLMRRGLTLIWVGWQWDVPQGEGRLRLHVPAVRAGDRDITGLVRADWTVDEPTDWLGLGHRGHRAYPVVEPDGARHVLTRRGGREAERVVVPRERWRFVPDPETGEHTGISVEGGFTAGMIYELVYEARHPRVVGLGLAVVRDVMAYSKHDLRSEFPTAKGVAFGVSQTGRFLRHFLYQGFNVDERGRTAFDGMLVHTAGAGRGSFNHRFAQPSRDAHRYSAFFYPTDLFPFTSRPVTDVVSGTSGGLLDELPEEHRPRVFFTNTGYEYWGRAASLIHTTPDGTRDVEPLPTERIYHLASGQHFVGRFPAGAGDVRPHASNPLDFLLTLRALAIALVDWVADDVEPPPSRYPRVDEGTLVPPAGLAFPHVGGLEPPEVVHVAYRADYGPRFRSAGIVDVQPPELGPAFPSLVAQVDGLGNEMGGVRGLEVRVPLATYTPWQVREGMAGGNGELRDFVGTMVPLPWTEAERQELGDPRPSVEALYGDKSGYLQRVVAAVQALWSERFLLEEDAGTVTERAEATWNWMMR